MAGIFDDILGGILDVGGTALSYLVPGIGKPLGQAASNIGSSLLGNGINQGNQAATATYNSPAAMMARYKAAGLNPDLIYSQGNTYSAPPVASATVPQATPFTATDYREQVLKNDNVHALTLVAGQDAALKAAQNQLVTNDALNASLRNELLSSTMPEQIDAVSLNNQKTWADIGKVSADTTFTVNQTKLNDELTQNTIAKTAQDIAESQARTLTLKDLDQMNQFELKLNQIGLTRNDGEYLRAAAYYLRNKFGFTLQ